MTLFLVFAFLFFIGSLIGWVIELFWRRYFSEENKEKKWVNPGFLVGPYLPLYGFSLCLLFLLAHINVSFIPNPVWQKIVLFAFMALGVTLLEYIAGLIFIKGMKVILWDYSNMAGNIQGIICPLFSFFWAVLSAIYYFLIHPRILNALTWLSGHLTFSFVMGLFYGVFIIDVCYSMKVLSKIRKFAAEKQIVVRYERLKQNINTKKIELEQKHRFLFALREGSTTLAENLRLYYEKESEKLKAAAEKKMKK